MGMDVSIEPIQLIDNIESSFVNEKISGTGEYECS